MITNKPNLLTGSLFRDVLSPPIMLKVHSEDVKRKDFCINISILFSVALLVPIQESKGFHFFSKSGQRKCVQKHVKTFFQPNTIKHASVAKLWQWPPYDLLLAHQPLSLSGVYSIWKGSISVRSFMIKCSPLKVTGYWEWKCEQERVCLW